MEVVRVFNNELSSLYEVKPPISKAKMTQITKSAIKGIKFYKHIVQSVEKFIQKCRAEYKVPGLYVVDSIVRQSRHQFGADKDVFGPRFLKNIKITFQYLYKCAEEDRCRIVRVLNLWQKNAVFASDVIQPLMDMAHPNTSAEWSLDALHAIDNDSPIQKSPSPSEVVPNSKHKSSDHSPWKGWPQGSEDLAPDTHTYAEMSKQNLEKFTKGDVSNFAEDESSRSSQIRSQLARNSETKPHEENAVKFNKKLLDFDYGDEDDEEEAKHDDGHLSNEPNALALSMAQNLLSNPELLRQLQQMQQSIQQNEAALKSELALPGTNQKPEDTQLSYSSDTHNSPHPSTLPPTCFESRLASFQQQFMPHEPQYVKTEEADKDDRVIQIPPPEPSLSSRDLDERSLSSIIAPDRLPQPLAYSDPNLMQFQYDNNAMPFPTQQLSQNDSSSMQLETAFPTVSAQDQLMMPNNQIDEDERVMYSMPGEPPLPPQDFDERSLMIPMEERGHRDRSRSGSQSRARGRANRRRSRSKSPRRRRSGSHERTRRNRSRSKERERIREKEKERERERERRRKGLPPIKKGCVSVCSTTLWLGHVPKSCSEVDISDTFGPFGTILSIDMIPPRGCAYVVMDRRQDGYRILQKNRNMKIQGSSIKMAWAPGKGVKGKEFKDYWDVDLGVSYVPFDKIRVDADVLDLLEEGGFIDEDTLSENLKALRGGVSVEKPPIKENKDSRSMNNSVPFEMSAQPTMVPAPMIPTSVSLPMVLPHLMQHQFGIHLPGLLPQAMVMPVPMGIPPPSSMLMVQQQSQGLLSGQGLPVGVPQMLPRGVPPVPQALKALKKLPSSESSLDSPIVTATSAAGDATPTEEDGTSISSPSTTMMSHAVSNSLAISSMPQFNQMMNLHNVNRPMLAVPPPTSSAGTPIPFPPPNVSFGFPPPGMRHAMPGAQGHGMGPITNAQFPWMQNPSDADIAFSNSGSVRLPHMSQSSGVPHPLFNIRPQFNDSSRNSPAVQTSGKDVSDSKQREINARDTKPSNDSGPPNRSNSPPSHDKMHQEMVISTDDDESMDQDYARNEVPLGPRFPTGGDFMPRNMGMPWIRGPPPGVMQGPRFPRGVMPGGPRFNPRMGGPRGMGGPGMHLRQEMDFGRHPDDRGHRMGMGGPPPPHQRRDMMPHGPEWYPDPRDFEPPVFDREPGRWFPPNDDRGHGRDGPWVVDDRHEMESRRGGRDRDWNRERVSDRLQKPDKLLDTKFVDSKHEDSKPQFNNNNNKPKPKPNSKELMDDVFRLQKYSQDKKRDVKPVPMKISESDRSTTTATVQNSDSSKSAEQHNEQPNQDFSDSKAADDDRKSSAMEPPKSELNSILSKRERDREARKRSRWGRTLSEEREFQQQKRNEIELKFQSYELSHTEQQSSVNGDPEPNGSVPESTGEVDETENIATSLPIADNSQSENILQTSGPADDGVSQLDCAQADPVPPDEVVAVPSIVEAESDVQEPCTQTTESLDTSAPAPVSLES